MNLHWYLISVIAVMSLATFLTRVLPFALLFKWRDHPRLNFLGHYLPPAAMLLLVMYCLKDISFRQAPHGMPEILASLLVVALHLWRRNALLSIGAGTVLYVYLIQSHL